MTNRRTIQSSGHGGWSDWRCERRGDHCAVTGRAEATGSRQTIAAVPGDRSVIEEVSRLVGLVNTQRDNDVALLGLAVQALKAIEEEGFTFATEMELENVIDRLEACCAPALCS
jgi:hypothetical protein